MEQLCKYNDVIETIAKQESVLCHLITINNEDVLGRNHKKYFVYNYGRKIVEVLYNIVPKFGYLARSKQ